MLVFPARNYPKSVVGKLLDVRCAKVSAWGQRAFSFCAEANRMGVRGVAWQHLLWIVEEWGLLLTWRREVVGMGRGPSIWNIGVTALSCWRLSLWNLLPVSLTSSWLSGQLYPHPYPTPRSTTVGHPQALLHPFTLSCSQDIYQTHTSHGTKTGAPQRFPLCLAGSQPASSPPQLTAAGAALPRQLQSSASCLGCVLPSPPLPLSGHLWGLPCREQLLIQIFIRTLVIKTRSSSDICVPLHWESSCWNVGQGTRALCGGERGFRLIRSVSYSLSHHPERGFKKAPPPSPHLYKQHLCSRTVLCY